MPDQNESKENTNVSPTKPRKRMGQPTKLTPQLQERICDLIRKGNYISVACEACGISPDSYYTWRNRGEQDRENGGGIFTEFTDAIKRTAAEMEAEMVENFKAKAGKGNTIETAIFLERRFRERWGRSETIHVDEETKQAAQQLWDGIRAILKPSPEIVEGEVIPQLPESEDNGSYTQ